MLKTIKRISMEDYNHLAIVFSESEVEALGLLVNDKLPIDESQFLKEVRE